MTAASKEIAYYKDILENILRLNRYCLPEELNVFALVLAAGDDGMTVDELHEKHVEMLNETARIKIEGTQEKQKSRLVKLFEDAAKGVGHITIYNIDASVETDTEKVTLIRRQTKPGQAALPRRTIGSLRTAFLPREPIRILRASIGDPF